MKTFKPVMLLFIALFLSFPVYAQKQNLDTNAAVEEITITQGDTVEVFSQKMKRNILNTIIVPAQYFDDELQEEQYPVVYLLNGYSGDHTSWPIIKPNIDDIASEMGVIIVCPDGQDSWYWDSPTDKNMQFETYITEELVPYVDNHYRTIPHRNMRAITGLSMGGHGALWLGIRHPDIFGAAGSTSGGVSIIPFKDKWKMKLRIGDYETNKEVWENHSVMSLVPSIKNKMIKLIMDCGSSDFFFGVNNDLHNALLEKGIEHDYIVRPGGHTKEYWNNSIDYQLLFFQKAFEAATETN